MLRRLYDWTLALAGRRTAEVWLAVIAFVESSFFLVPADVLFLPMALARRERVWRYALIATIASVLGADRICVLVSGRIVEQGKHSELLALGKYYARLYHLQFERRDGVEAPPTVPAE